MPKRPLHQIGTKCIWRSCSTVPSRRSRLFRKGHRWKRIKICNPSVPSTSKSVPEHRSYASPSGSPPPSTLPEIHQHPHSNDCPADSRPRQNMSRITPSSLSNLLYFKTRIIQIGARTPELYAIEWEHLHRTKLQAGCEKHTFQRPV